MAGEECKKYSENKNGPCLNGGNLICEGDTLVTEASCNCSESFSGKFCEIKTVPVGFIQSVLNYYLW